MASALMRRSVLTAALAAIATVASPLATAAFAADPALTTTPTFTPANGATVKANQPQITVAYNTPLNTGTSTLTLTDTTASGAVACPTTFTNNNATIGCTPTSSLVDGHGYTVSVHAENNDTSSKENNSASWTEDIPSLVSITPKNGDAVGSGSTTVTATYDEALDATSSYIRITNANGNFQQGGSLSASGPLPTSPKDTISFKPQTLPAGTYDVHVHAVANGNTAAFADTFINYTVNPTAPTQPASVSTAGASLDGSTHWINAANAAAVPFAGTADPNVRVRALIYDPNDSTLTCDHMGTACTHDRDASVGVTDCGKATCPWSLTVDTTTNHGLTDGTTYKYLVYAYTAGGTFPKNVAPSSGNPNMGKDTVAPGPGLNGSMSINGNTATVHDVASDSMTFAWKVTIADGFGNSVTRDNIPTTIIPPSANPPSSGSNELSPTNIDVSGLEDGNTTASAAKAITASIFAYDQAGNLSIADPAGVTATKESITLTPDFAHSFVTVDGVNISLANLNGSSIHTPTSITVKFNEPIRAQAATSSNKPPLYVTNLDLLDADGFPISGNPVINSDQRSMTWNVSGTPTDSGSPYTIQDLVAVSASCPNSGATTGNCEEWPYDTDAPDTASGVLATFRIDNTAPNVHILGINGSSANNGINADNIAGTVINGTVDSDATSVTLAIKGATGSTVLVPSDQITITPSGQSTSTWHTGSLNLAALADGVATVVASASDAANNHSPIDPAATNSDGTARGTTTTVKARPDAPGSFSAVAGNGQAVLAWSAPANTGAADRPVTSYSLTYTDTSVPGSSAVAAPSPAGTTTSTIVNGLQNGHTYSFSLAASNFDSSKAFPGGTGPATSASATPKGNTAMSLIGPSHGIITFGQSYGLGGNLTYAGIGVANEPVTVTSRYYNGAAGPTYHATTDQNGHWAVFGLKSAKNILYTASFGGDGSYNASSRSSWVLVRAAITISKVSARTKSHTSPVTLSGKVAPNFHGYRVYIYEVRGAKLVKIGSVKLSSKSTWAFVHTFSKGKHLVVAKFFGHSGNQTNQTGRVKIVRT